MSRCIRLNLDPGQRAFADVVAGPILAIAGAGTGKTHALTARVMSLVERGVRPGALLLLTFTQKAAREMSDRISERLPSEGREIWTGTFHRLAAQILRQEGHRLGYTSDFSIGDKYASVQMIRDLITELELDVSADWSDRILRAFSLTVNTDRSLGDVLTEMGSQLDMHLSSISVLQDAYCLRKLESNTVDYDDLLAHCYLLLESVPALQTALREQFTHILVDEYQDVNRLQALILDLLVGPEKNVAVVGDDAQSIYGFRGADVNQIRSFVERYPAAQIVRLEHNYRSTPQLVDLANRCNSSMLGGFRKTLKAVSDQGPLPVEVHCFDFDHEAAFIAARIKTLHEDGMPYGEQAVLFRTHSQMEMVETALSAHDIPFQIAGSKAFLHRKTVRTLLDHLRILVNPMDSRAWQTVLRSWPGIGPVGADELESWLFADDDPWGVLHLPMIGSGIGVRTQRAFGPLQSRFLDAFTAFSDGPQAVLKAWLTPPLPTWLSRADHADDYAQLLSLAAKFNSVFDLIERVSWSEIDGAAGSPSDDHSRVTLSTIHRAKGLEWEAVYLAGLVEGRLPLPSALNTLDHLEEERRLFYVAVTRARRMLHLCVPDHRNGDHGPVPMLPSRFVMDVNTSGERVLDPLYLEAPCS